MAEHLVVSDERPVTHTAGGKFDANAPGPWRNSKVVRLVVGLVTDVVHVAHVNRVFCAERAEERSDCRRLLCTRAPVRSDADLEGTCGSRPLPGFQLVSGCHVVPESATGRHEWERHVFSKNKTFYRKGELKCRLLVVRNEGLHLVRIRFGLAGPRVGVQCRGAFVQQAAESVARLGHLTPAAVAEDVVLADTALAAVAVAEAELLE
mmetsp:Transcript_18663/g.47651  ORF Transcript_18663/g.47651 Transcript_18663/m.47651 type:complete len:207 (+) Transcript_18663:1255-1875(+)